MYHVCRIKRAACPVAVFEFFSDPVLYLRRLALEGFHKFDDVHVLHRSPTRFQFVCNTQKVALEGPNISIEGKFVEGTERID